MAHCININHPEYKKLVPQFKGPEALLKAKISIWQENNGLDNFPTIDQLEERKNILYDKSSIEDVTLPKNGVSELFESNPELANAVYETLGFSKQINEIADTKKVDEFIKKYKEALPNIKNGRQLIYHLNIIKNRNNGDIKDFANLIIELSETNKTLKALLENPNLYAKEDSVGDEGAYLWNYATQHSPNQIQIELGHFTEKFGNYDEVFLHELIHNLTVGALSKESDLYDENFAKNIEIIYDEFINKFANNLSIDNEKVDALNEFVDRLTELRKEINELSSIEIYNRYKDSSNHITIKTGNSIIVRGNVSDINNINKNRIIENIDETISYYKGELIKANKGGTKWYYFLSSAFETKQDKMSEFLATFISNESFRNDLKLVPYKKNNLFNRIIELISGLFTLTKEDTLYNEFVLTLTDFISKNDYSNLAKQTQKIAYENRLQMLEQQKQQAQQLYSEYLDTIFPDSKVKDIVYHGTNSKTLFEKFIKNSELDAFYFTNYEDYAKQYGNIIQAVINITNPKIYNTVDKREYSKIANLTDKLQYSEYDGINIKNFLGSNELVVFEPEQIHILGSKSDIEGFRDYINTPESRNTILLQRNNITSKYENEIQKRGKSLLSRRLSKDVDNNVSIEILTQVADKLTKRTNIHYKIINFSEVTNKTIKSDDKGYYDPNDNIIYFIRENFTLETVFHEFAHPIVDKILYRNNKLYNELKDELLSDSYIDILKEIIKTYTLEDYKFDTKVTQEELNNYNDDELFKFFEELPKDVRIGLLSEGITNVWGQESEKWIDKKTGKVNLKLAEDSSLVRLWKTIVEWFKDFIRSGNVEDITPNTSFRKLGKLLAIDDSKFNLDVIKQNEVQYNLKAVDVLLSDKAKQVFAKGIKNNWDLNRILTELAIPKEQKQLLLDLGITDREQLALELASKYGFTVEINTAKVKEGKEKMDDAQMRAAERGEDYFAERDFYDEFEDIERQEIPTQHYVNLSARNSQNASKYKEEDGWEYQELEFKTPLITPSIKGHAQFATDNGIGWARVWYNKKTGVVEIQEIQSDLFQKGRNKEDLTFKVYPGFEGEPIETSDEKGNQFLQLLNKDNNWVTFFIKSIIQYLAKQTVTEVQESDVEAKVRELEKFGELEIDCSKVKAKNGIRSKFTKGSKWEIVKDLKGYPSHAHGGVDIKLGKDGFSFTGKDGIIKVAYGLVLPKIK